MGAADRTLEEIRRMTPIAAPSEQHAQMKALSSLFDEIVPGTATVQLIGPKGERISLPKSVLCLLDRVVEVMARGDSVAVVPVDRELTTQQAAGLLNVSRQYLVRLLDEGKIPFHLTGKHRRLRVEDVLSYKKARDSHRRAQLRNLSQMTQEFGGYDSEVE